MKPQDRCRKIPPLKGLKEDIQPGSIHKPQPMTIQYFACVEYSNVEPRAVTNKLRLYLLLNLALPSAVLSIMLRHALAN